MRRFGRVTRWAVVAVTAGTVLLVPPATAQAATSSGDGSVDQSFGEQGAAHTSYVTGQAQDDDIRSLARMKDGRLVGAGMTVDENTGVHRLALVRYQPDGVLDTSFGKQGVVVDALGAADVYTTTLALLPDGRVVASGWQITTGNSDAFFVARYTARGARDTTFGSNGVVVIPLGGQDDEATGMVMQPDGKVVISGWSKDPATAHTRFAAVRVTTAGNLDGTFGSGGIAYAKPSPTGYNEAEAVGLAATGDVILGGSAATGATVDSALVALTPRGRLDPAFGSGGVVTADLGGNDGISALGIQPSGRIEVAGATGSGTDVAARFLADGHRDGTFAGGGVTTLSVGTVHRIVFQRNSDALLFAEQPSLAATRLRPSGAVDTSFGAGGVASGSYPNSAPIGYTGLLLPNGRFLVAGSAYNQWTYSADAFTMRFFGDTVAPTARITSMPTHPTSRSFGLRWTGRDDNTGIVSYDVAYRSATYRSSSYGHWRTWKSHTRVRTAVFSGLAGRTYCFRIRGHDRAGNTGAWSTAPACTATPVDDRTATVHRAWSNVTGSHYYLHTARTSSARGASLTLPVKFRRLSVVVTTCPNCGVLKVYLGTSLLKQTLLYSPHRRDRQVVLAASGSTLRSGTLRLVQGSTGKPVVVDGVSVRLN